MSRVVVEVKRDVVGGRSVRGGSCGGGVGLKGGEGRLRLMDCGMIASVIALVIAGGKAREIGVRVN